MYINVRIRLKTGKLITIKVDLPQDMRNHHKDTIDDAVSDWLDENSVEYKWYRVEHL